MAAAWWAERRQRSGGGSFPSAWRWRWKGSGGSSDGGGGSMVAVVAARQQCRGGKQCSDGVSSTVLAAAVPWRRWSRAAAAGRVAAAVAAAARRRQPEWRRQHSSGAATVRRPAWKLGGSLAECGGGVGRAATAARQQRWRGHRSGGGQLRNLVAAWRKHGIISGSTAAGSAAAVQGHWRLRRQRWQWQLSGNTVCCCGDFGGSSSHRKVWRQRGGSDARWAAI